MRPRSPRPRGRPPPESTRRATSTGRPSTAATSLVCCRPGPSGRRPPMPDALAAAERARPETAPAGRWIGVPVRRTEDAYLLTGRGSFVGDLGGVAPLRGILTRPEFVATDMPILAAGRVRHVGEPVAAVLADSAYLAEDAAELVEVTYRELPAVTSAGDALAAGAAAVHDRAPGNVLVDVTPMSSPGLDETFASAAHVVEVAVSTGRITAAPMEGRACVAAFDERTGQIVLHTSTQIPHTVRTAVAESLGMDEHQVRVISPDVGGGFGQKCVVAREEVLAAAVARLLRRTVKWVEDRRESLTSGFQAREQFYRVRGAFDETGHVLGLDADIRCD